MIRYEKRHSIPQIPDLYKLCWSKAFPSWLELLTTTDCQYLSVMCVVHDPTSPLCLVLRTYCLTIGSRTLALPPSPLCSPCSHPCSLYALPPPPLCSPCSHPCSLYALPPPPLCSQCSQPLFPLRPPPSPPLFPMFPTTVPFTPSPLRPCVPRAPTPVPWGQK